MRSSNCVYVPKARVVQISFFFFGVKYEKYLQHQSHHIKYESFNLYNTQSLFVVKRKRNPNMK